MLEEKTSIPTTKTEPTIALLEHLSGPSIGTETLLYSENVDICLAEDRRLSAIGSKDTSTGNLKGDLIARLMRTGVTYYLEAIGDGPVWVNGRQIDAGELVHKDIIEFGEKGPLSRFRLIDSAASSRRYFSDICVDCWDYLQTSRRPVFSRTTHAISDVVGRIVSKTTLLFRVGVVSTLALLGFLAFQQNKINNFQQERLVTSQRQLDKFAQTLMRAKEEAITPTHLAEIREALSRDLSTNLDRLKALEQRSKATEIAIGKSANSVVFLQGAYGFRDKPSGRVMRYILGPTGRPIAGPAGQPLLSLDGDGPPAERQFTGTGFAIANGTILVTNRHVAVPWRSDDSSTPSASDKLEPFMIRFLAYSPDWAEGQAVELIKASDNADLALLRLTSDDSALTPLIITDNPVVQGGSLIVMGYPTGLRSMVARSGKAFVEELQKEKSTSFWDVARRLAERGFIKPLSSYGIVAQVTPDFLVYDAATTLGGSGGPVLNSRGEVVAVNTAILSGYAGSNLGVPAQKLHQLIAEAGIKKSIASN